MSTEKEIEMFYNRIAKERAAEFSDDETIRGDYAMGYVKALEESYAIEKFFPNITSL